MSAPGTPAMRGIVTAPPPAPRSTMMTALPDAPGAIPDEDLMTPEEMADAFINGDVPNNDDAAAPAAFDDNLAETLDEAFMAKTADQLDEMVRADLASRKGWEQRFARGLEIIGLKDFQWAKDTAPFEGASNAIAPVLSTAIVQSQARLMEEVWPAQGPAKTVVMGVETPQKRDSADRVADHMNYQLTVEDRTYYPETEKLGLYYAIYGAAYRKGYHDYVLDQNVLRFVTAEDCIMPYSARDLPSSPRISHRFKVEKNEFALGKKSGAYRQVDLSDPGNSVENESEIKQEKDKVDGITPEESTDDINWTFYATEVNLIVPGDEDTDEDGEQTGVALPYIVTWEKDSRTVLAIRRNWDQADQLKRREDNWAGYTYLPGIGVYGTGLIHWIGTIGESATDALRALLDSATWANLQGGFKAKDANPVGGELHMRPGAWLDVDMTSDELAKAFHTPPFKEPSEALFKLFGMLVDMAQKFSATTDLMVGDQDAKGAPVGTTVALIEQGSKVYSGIHKRAHFSCAQELRILYRLNGRFIPPGGYPYQVPGDDLQVFATDYDPKVTGVEPVSDPNIFSQTQRIALAQAVIQRSDAHPEMYDQVAAERELLKALRHPDIDAVLIDPDNMPDMDPVSENAALATGHPARAIEGQNHDAHIMVHMAFMQHPQFGGLPQAQQAIGPAMMQHIANHLALKQADVYRRAGVPIPPLDLARPAGQPIKPQGGPQQVDPNALAAAAAQQVGVFMQASGVTIPPDQANQSNPLDDELKKATIFNKVAGPLGAILKAGGSAADVVPAAQEAGQVGQQIDGGGQQPAQPAAPAPAPAGPPEPGQ